jgi:hypothetical protein
MTAHLPPLAGAKDRLLPVSFPVPFFAAALGFQFLAWLALAATSQWAPGFVGGLGPPLAVLHLVTLGTLAMVAIGASLQLLPVALRTPAPNAIAARILQALLIMGVPVLAYGMASGGAVPMSLGGAAVASGLILYAAITARALRRAQGSKLVRAHAWASLGCLLALGLLGLSLLGDFVHGWLEDHAALAAAHLIIASYGFLGLLVMGLSQVLVPMFALAPSPPTRPGWAALALAVAALLTASIGWLVPAALMALPAVLLHVAVMSLALRHRVRRRLGPSFALIRLGWGMLPASLVLGGAVAAGLLPSRFATLFGLVLIGGWLLSTVLGVLMRILPFLATLHAAKSGRRIGRTAELAEERLLWTQVGAHAGALLLLAAGVSFERTALVWGGGMVGAVGAGAFILFAALLAWRAAELPLRDPAAVALEPGA